MSYYKRHFQMRSDMLAHYAFLLGVHANAWERLVTVNNNLARKVTVYAGSKK